MSKIKEIIELNLEEVSLVDNPANQAAMIALYKRNTDMSAEQKVDKAVHDALVAEHQVLKGKLEGVEKELKELQDEKVAKAVETIEIGGEKVAKSSIPAPVLKELEALQKSKDMEDMRKRVEDVLPNTKGSVESKGKLLKAVGDDKDLLELLAAMDELFKSNFKEVGKQDAEGDMKTADEKLDALAKAHQKVSKGTYEQAYAEVVKTDEGRNLVKEIKKGSK